MDLDQIKQRYTRLSAVQTGATMGRKTSTGGGGGGGAMNPFKLAQPGSPSRNDFGASPRPELEDEEDLEQE